MHNRRGNRAEEDVERFGHVTFDLGVNGRHLVLRTERRVLPVAKTTDMSQASGGVNEVIASKASFAGNQQLTIGFSLMLKTFKRGRHSDFSTRPNGLSAR